MDDISDFKAICTGGLDSNRNYLDLSDNFPGIATELVNFEPSLFGGYRRLDGYSALDGTDTEVNSTLAEGKVLGTFIYQNEVYVARKLKAGTTYGIFKFDDGNDWPQETTGITHNTTNGGYTVTKVRFEKFTFGTKEIMIFVDGVNKATMFDGTTWTQIDSAGTGADFANAGGAQAIDRPSQVSVYRNHVFLGGDPDYPGLVAHSTPKKEFDWLVANGSGQIVLDFTSNMMKIWRDNLYQFGVEDISYVTVEGTDFVTKPVTKDIGCIAPDSVCEIAGDLMYLSQDGFRTISGTANIGDVQLSSISKRIQEDVRRLSNIYSSENICAVPLRRKTQVRIFYSSSTITTADSAGLIAGLRQTSQGGLDWEWGKLLGIQSYCVANGYLNGIETILHGDLSGNVFVQEMGNSFNGANIFARYDTPFFDMGVPTIRKTGRQINTFIRPEGSFNISVGLVYDWGSSDKPKPAAQNADSSDLFEASSIYGTAVEYGDGSTYGSGVFPLNKINSIGSFKSAQIKYTSNDTNPSYSIQSIIFELTGEGRR